MKGDYEFAGRACIQPGSGLNSSGNWNDAVPLFQRAIELDPNFVMAMPDSQPSIQPSSAGAVARMSAKLSVT
jgi:hypothetical protein